MGVSSFNHPNPDPDAFDPTAPFAELAMGEPRAVQPTVGIRAPSGGGYDPQVAIADATLGQDPMAGLTGSLFGTIATVQGGLSPWQQALSMEGWVAVCVRAKCNGIGKVPLRTYWRPNSKTPTRELINDPDLPLHQLFNNPNPLDTRSGLWDYATIFHELTGNAFWLKVRDGMKKVRELWPIPSQYLTPAHTKKRILDGYWMSPPYGAPFMIPREDVVHIRQANPADRFWGLGTLAAAANSVRVDDRIKAARLTTFNNDILSSLFFTCEQILDDRTWKRMMATLRNHHMGSLKAGQPVLLHGGVKPAQLQRAPLEMQFQESSKLSRDEILSVFNTPPLIAGVVENANNSNTSSQERIWALYGLRPILTRFQERINKDLVPEFDSRLEVEFDDPVPPDLKQQADIDKIYLDGAVFTPNMVLRRMGLPEVPWGDQPAPCASKAGPAADPSASAGRMLGVQGSIPRTGTAVIIRCGPRRRSRRRRSPRSRNNLDSEAGRGRGNSRRLLVRNAEADFDRLEDLTVPAIRKYFAAQSNRIKENVRRLFAFVPQTETLSLEIDASRHVCQWSESAQVIYAGGRTVRILADGTAIELHRVSNDCESLGRVVPLPSCYGVTSTFRRVNLRGLDAHVEGELDDWEKAADELAGKMLPKIEKAMATGGQAQLDALDLDATFNIRNVEAENWLKQKQRDYWKDTVNQTTKDLLSEKLAGVMADKPTMPKLIAAVDEVMGDRIQSSAKTIAQTEITGAYNGGSDITRGQCGVMQKEWIATLDGHTRASHYAANGQLVKQSGTFTVGGASLKYPGDPAGPLKEIVRCRCTSSAVVGPDDQIHVPGGTEGPKPKKRPGSKKPKAEKPSQEKPTDQPKPAKPLYNVVTAVAGYPTDPSKLKPLGTLGPRTTLTQDEHGRKWAVKTVAAGGRDADWLTSQAAAADMYRAMSVDGVAQRAVYESADNLVHVTPYIEGQSYAAWKKGKAAPEIAAMNGRIRQAFAADVIVGNSNVLGDELDHVVIDLHGSPHRVNLSASLGYSADGIPKPPKAFNGNPVEFWADKVADVARVSPQNAALFGKLDWETKMGQVGKITNIKDVGSKIRRSSSYGYADTAARRLESLAELAEVNRVMSADAFKADYIDSLSRHRVFMRDAGVFDRLPKLLNNKSNAVVPVDENGKPFDDLRGGGKDPANSLTGRYAAYLQSLGLDFNRYIANWSSAQGGSSWSNQSQAIKWLMTEQRTLPKPAYYWRKGEQVAKGHFDTAVKVLNGTDKMQDAFASYHAVQMEVLSRVDFANNDRNRRTVSLFRTEDGDVLRDNKVQLGKPNQKMKRGVVESTSIFRPCYVFGNILTTQNVPHHRVLGTYFLSKTIAVNEGPFLGDNENEFVAMLDGVSFTATKTR